MYIPILPMIGGKESAAQGHKGTHTDGRFSISHMWPQEHKCKRGLCMKEFLEPGLEVVYTLIPLARTHSYVHSYLQEILEILF